MLFEFLLDIVRRLPPEDALAEFKGLFLDYRAYMGNEGAFAELAEILAQKQYAPFANTLKRACYILINNWGTNRQLDCIAALVESLQQAAQAQPPQADRTRKRLHIWLREFVEGDEFTDLQLFAAKHTRQTLNRYTRPDTLEPEEQHWSDRYHSYLLVPQYVNTDNSPEQREAARALSTQLRNQFKFDLAMYTARSQSALYQQQPPQNPTGLGEEVLRLIKSIVAKRGRFSYDNLARLFLKQTEGLPYSEFKAALQNYMIFSFSRKTAIADTLAQRLEDALLPLYPERDEQIADDALILRTCNRLIDTLTCQDGQYPTELFVLLLSEGKSFTLVVLLLKLALVSNASRPHLEKRIAQLIKHYMQFPEDECDWVIQFFEIFNIAFAIHGDRNVQYDLIRVPPQTKSNQSTDAWGNYRIFAQYKDGYSPHPMP
ncbi:MAG: hypothetical protein ACPGVO_00290 [Spirulinaceae cyanobacterium]